MIESIFFNPWIWIIPIFLILALGLMIADRVFYWDGIGLIVGGIVFILAGIGYFGFLLPPYDVSFYQTYKVTGEITEMETAFSGDEGTMSQVFIAAVDGVDYYIKSDDQRFRTLEVGDDADFVCGKVFNYFQQPYYSCSFSG